MEPQKTPYKAELLCLLASGYIIKLPLSEKHGTGTKIDR